MRRFLNAFALSAALLCSLPVLAQELTEDAVKAFSKKIDAAVARRDVDGVMNSLADHVAITATVNLQGRMQTLRINKSQYRMMLESTLARATNYTNKRSNEKITIEGIQATVTADVTESVTVDGKSTTARSRERATIEYVGGDLKVVKLFSTQLE